MDCGVENGKSAMAGKGADMMPFFSIVIPVYNTAPYLRECLDSVHAQTFGDWECLCVDDGSTDGSGAILDDYAARDRRFRVFHQANGGVSAARNRALDELSTASCEDGGYVWFLDSDDSINPDSLLWLHETIRLHGFPWSFSFPRSAVIEGSSVPRLWPALPPPFKVEVFKRIDSRVLRTHRTGVWSAIARRRDVCRERFENYSVGEDVLFISRILWNSGSPWICAEAPLYFYRKRRDSAVNSAPCVRSVIDECETNRKMLELIAANRGKWSFHEIRDFLDWNRNFVWNTYNGMLFRMRSIRDMNRVIPAWCALQRAQQVVRPEGFYRRFAVWLLEKIPNGRLCKLLVRIIPGWAGRVCGKVHSVLKNFKPEQ